MFRISAPTPQTDPEHRPFLKRHLTNFMPILAGSSLRNQMVAGIGALLGSEHLHQRDVAIGIVLALMLGLGLLFLHFFTAYAMQVTALLFGNVLAVDVWTVWTLLAVGVVIVAALAIISRPLLFASLQPEVAEAKGVSLRLYSVLFLAIVALATAECAQIVGVLLVFALMVGPAAAAQRLTSGIGRGLLLSAVLALLEAWAGITLAFYTDWPSSFWISALSAGVYLFAAVWPTGWIRRPA
jgi:zinc/manganese transport system permease protein